eukprot:6379066-Amphidinium_carterae.1
MSSLAANVLALFLCIAIGRGKPVCLFYVCGWKCAWQSCLGKVSAKAINVLTRSLEFVQDERLHCSCCCTMRKLNLLSNCHHKLEELPPSEASLFTEYIFPQLMYAMHGRSATICCSLAHGLLSTKLKAWQLFASSGVSTRKYDHGLL